MRAPRDDDDFAHFGTGDWPEPHRRAPPEPPSSTSFTDMPADPATRQPSSALQGLYTQTPDVSAFAVDAKAPPADKAATWVVGPDQMVLACAFNAMRAEVTKFEATLVALGDRDPEAWELETIEVRHARGRPDSRTTPRRRRDRTTQTRRRVSGHEPSGSNGDAGRFRENDGQSVIRTFSVRPAVSRKKPPIVFVRARRPDARRLPPPLPLRSRTEQDWWSFHVEHIRSYHATETSVLMPFLRRRAVPSAAHVPSFAALDRVADAVARLLEKKKKGVVDETKDGAPATPTRTVTSTPSSEAADASVARAITETSLITRLASAVHGYRAVLYAYLAEKEKVLVPTLRAFFAPEEVFAAFAEILRKTPRLAFGSLVHHLAGGEEAVRAFNARAVVSRSWRFGYGETVKHRSAYRAKVEARLERLLAGDANAAKKRAAGKTRLERVDALTPLELNERLVVAPSSSEALARAITDELASAEGTVAGADVARSRTSQTKARLVNLAIGV